MEKTKASDLLYQMIFNSQKVFIAEDENYIQSMHNILANNMIPQNQNVDCKTLVSVIHNNNEFMRISFIKTILQTLIENNIIENDIDIFDVSITNKILCNAVDDLDKLYENEDKN